MGANSSKTEIEEEPKTSLKRRLTMNTNRTATRITSVLRRSSTKRVLTGPRLRQTIRPCVDACEEQGLLSAIEKCHHACVMKHLIGGDSPDVGTTKDDMPVILACKNPEILELLLEFGCDINRTPKADTSIPSKRTPLHFAAEYGYLTSVKLLIHYGANVDAHDANNITPLMLAWDKSQDHVAEYLLSVYLRDKKAGSWGHHALMQSCQNGQLDFVQMLIVKGHVNPNAHDQYDGSTPLIAAAKFGHIEIVRFLLTRNVDATYRDKLRNFTAGDYASVNGHRECWLVLQEASEDLKEDIIVVVQTTNTPQEIVK
ncbi:ankyrin repeat RBE_0220 [Octopus vulgaris]|uniref:Ankyrin repeat RBE_0220 n=1 Tax=Octopus vulgaris TaxID=6645 RepID=A0AA36B143_OCTVU|nr:ankyrin repeat RBE_0220 [Octopus vulgaris]